MYLNYGLLGLATILYDKGYENVQMFQGDYKPPASVLEEILKCGIDVKDIRFPVFVSVPSFFSVEWAQDFIQQLKELNSGILVVLGGRWVVDRNIEWIQQYIPEVDFVCRGCPDEIIDQLIYSENWERYSTMMSVKNVFSHFNYPLLNNFMEYQPQVEISRGCPMQCEFCLEKNYDVSFVKSPQDVMLEIEEVMGYYKTSDLNFYFEAAMFNPTIEWATEFYNLYKEKNMGFHWRFESRVDTLDFEVMKILSKAGLKVIDLGLESASVIQLQRMNKSANPKEYLERASQLIKVLHSVGIWAKLNILLYLGETKETINETIHWLDIHKKYIKGVSVNPFILYLDGDNTEQFLRHIENETKITPDIFLLSKQGYMYVDLSPEISVEDAKKYSNYIADRYMSKEDFLDLKKICYMKRSDR